MLKKVFPRQNPNIDLEDLKCVYRVIRAGEVFSGPLIDDFERKLSDYTGIKHTIMLNMGRAAEFLALKGLGLSEGDEIIMPSYNFPIVPILVKMLGLKPVFVDVEPDTFNIDPSLIEKNITGKTKAIFVTHMCGHPCDMDKILEIKNKYGLRLVEDAVQSLGAEYKNKKVGTFGDVSYFSFYVGKNMTTFMGAAVCTNNRQLYLKMKEMADSYKKLSAAELARGVRYGLATYLLTKPWIFSFTVYPVLLALNLFNSELLDQKMSEPAGVPKELSFHYLTRFSNLQAAMGLSQLGKISNVIEKRIQNSLLLTQGIKSGGFLVTPTVRPQVKHSFLYYFVRAKNRKQFRKKLILKGVDTKRDTNLACSHLSVFKDEYKFCPVSESISRENTLIPNYPALSGKDIAYLASCINRVAEELSL
jgi:perosamine synthetase